VTEGIAVEAQARVKIRDRDGDRIDLLEQGRLSKSLYLILVGESRTIVIKYASGASVRLQGNDFSAQ
jgi:hypothetical protein